MSSLCIKINIQNLTVSQQISFDYLLRELSGEIIKWFIRTWVSYLAFCCRHFLLSFDFVKSFNLKRLFILKPVLYFKMI